MDLVFLALMFTAIGFWWGTESSTRAGEARATCYAADLDYVTVTDDGTTAVCGAATDRRALPIPQPPVRQK